MCSFESEFARHVRASHAVAVSSGTTALELALEVLGLPPGSRVLVSTLSSFAVAQAIVRAGLRPVLVDVSTLTGMPSVDTIGEAATHAKRDGQPPSALVIGHWAGDPADVAALADAAELPPAMVVEDAAQGLGGSLGVALSVAQVLRASASTRPRTCRWAKGAWSPPTTPNAPSDSEPHAAGRACPVPGVAVTTTSSLDPASAMAAWTPR